MSKTHKIHTGKLNDSKDLKDILPNSASDSILDEEAAPEEEVNRSSNPEDMIDILDSANFNQSVEAAAEENEPVFASADETENLAKVEVVDLAAVPEHSDLPMDQ